MIWISVLIEEINKSNAKLLWISNLKPESSASADSLSIEQKLSLLRETGLRQLDGILWPDSVEVPEDAPDYLFVHKLGVDENGLHQQSLLKQAIWQFLK